MFVTIYEDNINDRQIDNICSLFHNEGLLIVPTDTLYAFACEVDCNKAAHRLAMLKGKKLEKSNFSIICDSISMASKYTKPLTKQQFAFIKNLQTGGFTFVFKASNLTPKVFQNKKRTIGIRITQNKVLLEIIHRLEKPLLVSSLPRDNAMVEEYTDSELIYQKYSNKVEALIDIGKLDCQPSTVVDMTQDNEYQIIRQGLGVIVDD